MDKNDDVLGVYHRWIEELANKFEKISVICLYRGQAELPSNVAVYSLGKETNANRWSYFTKFYRLIWSLRREYDVVFVHMNPEYVLLGGLLWRILGKRITLWYAHYLANWKIVIASWLSNKIVTSVRLAYPLKSKKLEVLQQGIDTDRFKSVGQRMNSEKFKVLSLGRIAPVKDLETLVRAIAIAKDYIPGLSLTIIGNPTSGREAEAQYYEKIRKLVAESNLGGVVEFSPAVPNYQTPQIYNQYDLFVNLTVTGSFDKSTLEAMSCGLPVLVSNRVFTDIFPDGLRSRLMFPEKNFKVLAEGIIGLARVGSDERRQIGLALRDLIIAGHGLNGLMNRLADSISSA